MPGVFCIWCVEVRGVGVVVQHAGQIWGLSSPNQGCRRSVRTAHCREWPGMIDSGGKLSRKLELIAGLARCAQTRWSVHLRAGMLAGVSTLSRPPMLRVDRPYSPGHARRAAAVGFHGFW